MKADITKSRYYNPQETPRAYPLELTENLHICLWDENGKYKWSIALWERTREGYELRFVGDRPLHQRVKWATFKRIVKQGQALANKRFDAERLPSA